MFKTPSRTGDPRPHPEIPTHRRWLVTSALTLALGAVCAAPGPASAQAGAAGYPSKPVRFITNFPAGGPTDILARLLADALQKDLRQPFVVENRPGAGGNVGADAMAKSPADGYTVLFAIDTTFTINPSVYASMPFRPEEVKPLMVIGASGLLFGVHPGVGVRNLDGFIAKGRATPQNFASAGNGSPGHIAMAVLADATGMKVTHIPYKGNAPAVQAILAGEVQAGILAASGLLAQVQAGKIQALAVTSRQRSELLPQVPTVAEAGLKALEFEVLQIAMVPAGTPEPVVQVLQKAMAAALARPEMKARLANLDMQLLAETGEAAAQHLEANRARYARIIQSTGMKVD